MSQVAALKIISRSGIVYEVEDIVDLNPQLSFNVFGDPEVLKHREVDLVRGRAAKLVTPFISVGARSGRGERRRIELVIGAGGSIRGGYIREGIAHHLRPIVELGRTAGVVPRKDGKRHAGEEREQGIQLPAA